MCRGTSVPPDTLYSTLLSSLDTFHSSLFTAHQRNVCRIISAQIHHFFCCVALIIVTTFALLLIFTLPVDWDEPEYN